MDSEHLQLGDIIPIDQPSEDPAATSKQGLVGLREENPTGLEPAAKRSRKSGKPALVHTSRFRGVSLHQATNRWKCQIKVGKRDIILGRFTDPEEAAHSFDRAAICVRGTTDSSKLNFPFESYSNEYQRLRSTPFEDLVKELRKGAPSVKGNATSMYTGVRKHTKSNTKWESYVRLGGKHVHLGLYESELAAAQAHDQGAILRHAYSVSSNSAAAADGVGEEAGEDGGGTINNKRSVVQELKVNFPLTMYNRICQSWANGGSVVAIPPEGGGGGGGQLQQQQEEQPIEGGSAAGEAINNNNNNNNEGGTNSNTNINTDTDIEVKSPSWTQRLGVQQSGGNGDEKVNDEDQTNAMVQYADVSVLFPDQNPVLFHPLKEKYVNAVVLRCQEMMLAGKTTTGGGAEANNNNNNNNNHNGNVATDGGYANINNNNSMAAFASGQYVPYQDVMWQQLAELQQEGMMMVIMPSGEVTHVQIDQQQLLLHQQQHQQQLDFQLQGGGTQYTGDYLSQHQHQPPSPQQQQHQQGNEPESSNPPPPPPPQQQQIMLPINGFSPSPLDQASLQALFGPNWAQMMALVNQHAAVAVAAAAAAAAAAAVEGENNKAARRGGGGDGVERGEEGSQNLAAIFESAQS